MKGGGRCWFAVDSKSFEISVEVFGERCKGIIVERSRGFTSWVRFGSFSLCCLLEGVEACCRGVIVQGLVKRWEDGGRRFKLESRVNEAGRFLLCSVVDQESKRYCLVFPEGKGIMGGWVLLAEKLRFLGVMSRDEPRGNATFYGTGSTVGESAGKAQKSYADVVKSREKKIGETLWLQLGEKEISSERKLMDRCLVGSWGHTPLSDSDMYAFESWGRTQWNIKGGLKFARIGGPLLLIEFENRDEADKVLLRGSRWFKESNLHLARWDPKAGCSQNGERAKSVWVRVVGLPLHYWSQEAFRKIGDCCGGFVAVDENTAKCKELRWARISVRFVGEEWPSTMQVVVGSLCYALQLWWEVKPGLSEVVPAKSKEKGKERDVRDDGEGDTRAGFKRVSEKTRGAPAKVDVKYKGGEGSCSKQAQSSGTVSGAATEMDGSTGDRPSARGKSPCSGLGGNMPLGRQGVSGWVREPEVEGQGFKSSENMGRPNLKLIKSLGGEARPSLKIAKEVRAPDGRYSGGGEQEGDLFGSTLGSPRPTINFSEITDEALLEEASRYSVQTHSLSLSLGKRDISFFSTPSGWDGEGGAMVRVSDKGSASDDGGGAVMDPLRVILADGREEVVSNLVGRGTGNTEELSVGALERASQEDEEERGKEGELCWQSSSLAKFSRYLGMPTEGFEGEILFLLKRMTERKLQKGKLDGRKRRKLELSKFERELRKLEWTVNYMGGGGGGEGGGSMSRSK
ncbi:hypothetical protein CK203_008571 [Vitis vinifera]|uniref:DUF4283 domain-containing protein n=1 Tax=Vitis vinifera TaxID=29760 RepID=A0A438KDE9_VITVI|nr:hypothetical protein CK203_008571 [Vitis vinifera]